LAEEGPDRAAELKLMKKAVDDSYEKQASVAAGLRRAIKKLEDGALKRLTKEEVARMILQLETQINERLAKGLDDEFIRESLGKMGAKVQTKVSYEDALKMIQDAIGQFKDHFDSEKADDANGCWTLRSLAIPETIALGKVQYKVFPKEGGLTKGKTNRATTNALPKVPSTVGRTGGLKSLQPQSTPMVPIDDPVAANTRRW